MREWNPFRSPGRPAGIDQKRDVVAGRFWNFACKGFRERSGRPFAEIRLASVESCRGRRRGGLRPDHCRYAASQLRLHLPEFFREALSDECQLRFRVLDEVRQRPDLTMRIHRDTYCTAVKDPEIS